jgi:hypothetical protein
MREWGYFHVAGHANDLIGGKEGISGGRDKKWAGPSGRRLSFSRPALFQSSISTHDDLSPLHFTLLTIKAAKLLKQNETGLSAYRTAKRDGTDE